MANRFCDGSRSAIPFRCNDGRRELVWAAITNIENAAKIISGIEKIEVLEQPVGGVVGLKWRETRILFGDPASVDKWITDAADGEFYTTRAEAQGFAYLCTKRISEGRDGMVLTESHESQPLSIGARFMLIPMSLLFKGAIRKALLQDLNDIKTAVEKEGAFAAS
jgi:hypothetical protein